MVVDRDLGGDSYVHLTDRDKQLLRARQEGTWKLLPGEAERIAVAVAAVGPYTGRTKQDEEDYELNVLDQLVKTLPASLVPAEPSIRVFLAQQRTNVI
ncbi:hypothetical protein [Actinoplanes sp. NPDC020271]|uniref:hypothetical protein n=1 Tax=Actinoplanes sp. NPDC020271 TaxID=3363896 RepID=UPI0037B7E4FE